MEIILSQQCESLTGTLGRGYGYAITRRGKRFFSIRSPKPPHPFMGHWLFIAKCAEMTNMRLHIADISIHHQELQDALEEAHHFVAAQMVYHNYYDKAKLTYNARDIINLKHTFGL